MTWYKVCFGWKVLFRRRGATVLLRVEDWALMARRLEPLLVWENEIPPVVATTETIIAFGPWEELDALDCLTDISNGFHSHVILGQCLDSLEICNNTERDPALAVHVFS